MRPFVSEAPRVLCFGYKHVGSAFYDIVGKLVLQLVVVLNQQIVFCFVTEFVQHNIAVDRGTAVVWGRPFKCYCQVTCLNALNDSVHLSRHVLH
jgi:hypothetical protein